MTNLGNEAEVIIVRAMSVKGIDCIYTRPLKIGDVAGNDGKFVFNGGGCDQAIANRQWLTR